MNGHKPRGLLPLLWAFLSIPALAGPDCAVAGNLQPRLLQLLSERFPGGEPVLGALGRDGGEGVWRVQVLVSPAAGAGSGRAELERSLSSIGASIRGRSWRPEPRVWEVELPPERISRLAELTGVIHVGTRLGPLVPPAYPAEAEETLRERESPPDSPETAAHARSATGEVESEALGEMNVPDAHAFGYRGRDVRVGVVDVGFDGYLERIGTELPSRVSYRNFTDGPSSQSHGAACAELISDVAPESELFLAEIGSSLELQEAIDWFVENQVEVVSHSLAWFLGGGDGTGPIVEMTERAADEGIQWITSSGNFRRSYWEGAAIDADMDGWIEMGTARGEAVRIESGSGTISLILSWDRWPLSESVSFQIDVFQAGQLRGTSETDFGSDYPFAFREITIPSGTWTSPEFRIRSDRGDPEGIQLRVFRVDGGFLESDDRVESGSLAIPADSPFALSVGAYSYRGTTLEPFSSYGPTGAGLMKPDLIAADAVSTSLPRYPHFVGTSAACPHVAGAVALLLSAQIEGGAFDLHWSRDEISALLRSAAEPFGGVDEDEQGWGRLRIPLSPGAAASSPLTVLRSGPNGVVLRLRGVEVETAPTLGIFDVGGRRVASVRPGGTNPGASAAGRPTVEYELSRSVVSLRTGRYWAQDPRSGASAPFIWAP